MAYTSALPVQGQATLVQNTVYALPARAVTIFSNVALETSTTTAFTTNGTVAANTPTKVCGVFVRCTTSAAVVFLSPD